MTDAEQIAALKEVLADLIGFAERAADRAKRRGGAKTAQSIRASVDRAEALLGSNRPSSSEERSDAEAWALAGYKSGGGPAEGIADFLADFRKEHR